MSKMKKIEYRDDLYLYLDVDTIFNCSLEEAAKNILSLEQKLRSEHQLIVQQPNKYEKFGIRIATDDGYPEIKLFGVRTESDEAFKIRMDKAEKLKISREEAAKKRKNTIEQNKEAKELAEYERLSKKFGKL
jgi:hypothetical protein